MYPAPRKRRTAPVPRNRRRPVPRQGRLWYLPVAAAGAALILLLAASALLLTPGTTRPAVVQGDFTIFARANGNLEVSWPAAEGAGAYLLYVRSGGEGEYTLLGRCGANVAVLESADVDRDAPLGLLVRTAAYGKNLLGMTREFTSRDSLSATVSLGDLSAPEAVCAVRQEDRTARLTWAGDGESVWEICRLDGAGNYLPVTRTEDTFAEISFGDGGDLELPEAGQAVRLTVRAVRRGEGWTLYGPWSRSVSVEREELLGRELNFTWETGEDGVCTLRWEDAPGDRVEIQEWNGETGLWEVLGSVENTAEPVFSVGPLASGSLHRYRLAAWEGADQAALSDGQEVRAPVSALRCTVWPVKELPLCAGASLTEELDAVPAGTALVVLGEEGDAFRVRLGEQTGYVDSRYCLIDLSGYLGDWCSYDIVNSRSCPMTAHGYPLWGITGSVPAGYEDVLREDGSFLVPLLYPAAKKLLTAAQAAREDGYTLRIADAFRPGEASAALYEAASALLDEPVPEKNADGEYVYPESSGETEEAGDEGEEPLTYGQIISDGRLGLDDYLEAGTSPHSLGLAVDVTLEDASGEEVPMQTDLYDLSWRSAAELNTEDARRLAGYMEDAGFLAGESSWWHFRDGGTSEALDLGEGLAGGVSPASSGDGA